MGDTEGGTASPMGVADGPCMWDAVTNAMGGRDMCDMLWNLVGEISLERKGRDEEDDTCAGI